VAASATCTADCFVFAGDLLAVRFAGTVGASTIGVRNFTLTLANIGQIDTSRFDVRTTAFTRYGNFHAPWIGTTANQEVVRVEPACTLRNLYVHVPTPPPTPFTVTVCGSSASSPDCTGTRPVCTVAAGSQTCSDTTNWVTLNTGDFYNVRLTN